MMLVVCIVTTNTRIFLAVFSNLFRYSHYFSFLFNNSFLIFEALSKSILGLFET